MNALKFGLLAAGIINWACETHEVHYYYRSPQEKGKAQKIFERLSTIVGVANTILTVNLLTQIAVFHFTKRAVRILPFPVMFTAPIVILGMRISVMVAGFIASKHPGNHERTLYSTLSNSFVATQIAFAIFGSNHRAVNIICGMTVVGELAYRILFLRVK